MLLKYRRSAKLNNLNPAANSDIEVGRYQKDFLLYQLPLSNYLIEKNCKNVFLLISAQSYYIGNIKNLDCMLLSCHVRVSE